MKSNRKQIVSKYTDITTKSYSSLNIGDVSLKDLMGGTTTLRFLRKEQLGAFIVALQQLEKEMK